MEKEERVEELRNKIETLQLLKRRGLSYDGQKREGVSGSSRLEEVAESLLEQQAAAAESFMGMGRSSEVD